MALSFLFLSWYPQFRLKSTGNSEVGTWTERAPSSPLILGRRRLLMLREWGKSLVFLFPTLAGLQDIPRRGSLAAAMELTSSRACRDAKPTCSDRRSCGPTGWSRPSLLFSLSLYPLSTRPRCGCSHQKCTAEQVTKALSFWPEDWKRGVQGIGNYQGYHGGGYP